MLHKYLAGYSLDCINSIAYAIWRMVNYNIQQTQLFFI